MKSFATVASIAVLLSMFSPAHAKDDALQTKWTGEVGAVIKIISVVSDQPISTMRFVTVTYQALKPCRSLSVFGKKLLPRQHRVARVRACAKKQCSHWPEVS